MLGVASRNFYRCTGCFQSNRNIACRNTQSAARKYHSLLKITHDKTINSFIQYCAKEMQTKFAEIGEITRISAINLRTFASNEKAAKFRCFYCSNVGEISQARWLIETKFRARWTKFRVIRTKFRFDEAKFRFGETKYRLDETKFRFHETKFGLWRICSWPQNNCNHNVMQKYRYM